MKRIIKSTLKILKVALPMAIGVLVVMLLVQNHVISVGLVDGPSMEPTFHNGDWFIYHPCKLWFRSPNRGEVVVLIDNDNIKVMKRITMVPGDWDYLSPGKPRKLGKNEYVVLGDNIAESVDSRTYGTVAIQQIIGVVQMK